MGISLLGPIRVTLDGQPATGFKSNKVRALLAYLVVEAGKPHRRETLAALLWPDWSDREALGNLRYALSDLRGAIDDRAADPPFLIISRDSIQFNPASAYRLDIAAFAESAGVDKNHPDFVEMQEKASGLYRGSFLEGFYADGSPTFDDWMIRTRERLARQASASLHALADYYEERGEYEKAQSLAWRQLELEPWDEYAHRQLMRGLALTGQRSAALAQYESCRKTLKAELAVEPSDETRELYEQIRSGILKPPRAAPAHQAPATTRIPAFLQVETPRADRTILVSREGELARLSALLEQALAGQGRVAFVTGEAGSGKTALIQEFTRRSQAAYGELLVASGNCNAYTGMGDPYLPFREMLELLSGDVEAGSAAGTITRDHALRLWKKIPVAVHALLDTGPDLIDTFVRRSSLLERAKASVSGQPDWSMKLEEFLARKPGTIPSAVALHQADLFEQYTRVLQALEQESPLLLVIDDLQWADSGSVNLLFHLGRRIKGSRILILGAYRPEEVTLGREGGRHPLEPVMNELRREFGDVLLDVGQMDGRKFIEGFLDSEPHRLGPSFREMLYHHTQGHPLFTVELLRGLQERGDIIRDAEGRWIEGPSLDWVTLPVRVEAAIQERIGRLPEELQKTLAVASVEGELFTAEVVSRVRAIEKHRMLEHLSGGLEKKHRLVHAHSIQRVNDMSLSRYRFQHILFQRYLYGSLDEVERVHLHEQVGSALEGLYGDSLDVAANAVQMARHFEEARIVEKAAHYLYIAGIKAVQLSAYQDGIAHLTRGLALLETLPPSAGRDRQELDLQIALGFAYHGPLGTKEPEVEHTFTRARDLSKELGSRTQMVQVLGGLVVLNYVRGELHLTQELAREGLELAEEENDPLLMMLCHWHLGFVLFCLGDIQEALRHLRYVLDAYDPSRHHHALLLLRGADPGLGAMAYEVCCLWCLGYPDQALERSRAALTLAHELNHPFSLADVLCFAGCLLNAMRRDGESLAKNAVELLRLAKERNMAAWLGTAMRYQAEALVLQGKIEAGTAQAQKEIMAMVYKNEPIYFSGTFATLAEVQMNTGQLEEAQATLNEAFAVIEEIDERYWEAEVHRLQGEVLLKQGQEAQAETSLQRAIEIARRQDARSLELRAAMGLGRLWNRQGKTAEARQLLGEVYNWFTEGFDTPDLVEAGKLLEEMADLKGMP